MATGIDEKFPSDSYKDLMMIANGNAGLDATMRVVCSGNGAESPMKISTAGVMIPAIWGSDNPAYIRLTSDGSMNYYAGYNSAWNLVGMGWLGFTLGADRQVLWSGANGDASAAKDAGINRYGAGAIQLNDGSTGHGAMVLNTPGRGGAVLGYYAFDSGLEWNYEAASFGADAPVAGVVAPTATVGVGSLVVGRNIYTGNNNSILFGYGFSGMTPYGFDVGLTRGGVGTLKVSDGATGPGSAAINRLTLGMGTPPTVSISATDDNGVTYYYFVYVNMRDGTLAGPFQHTWFEHGPTTLDGTHYIDLSWTAVAGAVSYDVYRVVGFTSTGKISTQTGLTLRDNGLTGDLSSPYRNCTAGMLVLDNNAGAGGIVQTRAPGMECFRLTQMGMLYITALGLEDSYGVGAANWFQLQSNEIDMYSGWKLLWSSDAYYYGAKDVGLVRSAANTLKVTAGATGEGILLAGAIQSPSETCIDWAGLALKNVGGVYWGNGGAFTTPKDVSLHRESVGILRASGGAAAYLGFFNAGVLKTTQLGRPQAPVITNAGTPGSTTWGYKVVALMPDGSHTDTLNEGTTDTGAATLNGTDYNIITITPVTNAYAYDVYRTTAGGSPSSTGRIITGWTGLTCYDTGLSASGTPPTVNTTGILRFFDGNEGEGPVLAMNGYNGFKMMNQDMTTYGNLRLGQVQCQQVFDMMTDDAFNSRFVGCTTSAADPTTTELPADRYWGLHKNTNSGKVFLAFNDGGGTIKKVELT